MSGYVAAPFPDEMFYSVIARTMVHRGICSPSRATAEFFGSRHAVASFDLQGRLDVFAQQFPENERFAADHIIDHLTLFPFFTAFVSETSRIRTRGDMRQDILGTHMRLGISTFRIPRLRALRFCPSCVAAWTHAGEEWRWLRVHQLPGVLVCPDHGCVLVDSQVKAESKSRHAFIAAASDTCCSPINCWGISYSEETLAKLTMMARAGALLLEAPPEPRELRDWSDFYRARLAEIGMARSDRRIDLVQLRQQFDAQYGEIATALGLEASSGVEGNWLDELLRSARKATHPALHLLLQVFLDNQSQVERPFGSGPWACRNPLAVHSGEMVVTKITRRRSGAITYGDFLCGCGYGYTCSITSDGVSGPPRYKTYGPMLLAALRDLVAKGTSLREVGRTVGLDPKTVMREAQIGGLEMPWAVKPSGATTRRDRPVKPKPPKRPPDALPTKRLPRRPWAEIDRAIALDIGNAELSILSASPPLRVTMAEVERRVAKQGWLTKRHQKLPITFARLKLILEDADSFRARRLEYVIASLASGPSKSNASDILRSAGLPMSWMPHVRSKLRERGDGSRNV